MRTSVRWSLRRRIVAVFALCMLSTLICTVAAFWFSYDRLVVKRVNANYESAVKQFTISLENLINNLNHVSQQLAFSEAVKLRFERYLMATDPYERIDAYDELKKIANYAVFSNPTIGFYYYTDVETGEVIFSNFSAKDEADLAPSDAEVFFRYAGASYYGMYRSKSRYTDNMVVAITRDMEILGRAVRLYVETNFREMDDLFASFHIDEAIYLLVDNDDRVVYSQNPESFSRGFAIDRAALDDGYGEAGDFLLFAAKANQGWKGVLAIDKGVFLNEALSLAAGMLVIFILLAALFALCAITLWRRIYKPLARFDREMSALLILDAPADQPAPDQSTTGVVEYDRLSKRFRDMRGQIRDMIEQIREQERVNAQIEVQRLRSQINPHFLMNTLNSLHWLAVLKGENEIDDMVLSLNRLLMYNLNEDDGLATLLQEREAVSQYVELQTRRYNFTYDCDVIPENASLDIPFPKFVLQPMIENALSHGYREDMTIRLVIDVSGERIIVRVEDDGVGMSPEAADRLRGHLQNNNYNELETVRRSGMGIGLRYVVRTVNMFYPGDVCFRVESEPNVLTVIELSVPREVNKHD